jgi:hypothetical protein
MKFDDISESVIICHRFNDINLADIINKSDMSEVIIREKKRH